MEIGMTVFGIALGLLGYQGLGRGHPEVGALLMALSMVVPMAAWMRFGMGHEWYMTGEMSAAMVVPILVLVTICLLGFLPHMVALAWSMPVMYVAMLGVMFYRWSDYTEHHHAAAKAALQRETPVIRAPGEVPVPGETLAVR
jgi:hypothetical protein